MSKDVTTIGVDIAKHTFHLIFANERGKPIQRKQLSRAKFSELIQTHEKNNLCPRSLRHQSLNHITISKYFINGKVIGNK